MNQPAPIYTPSTCRFAYQLRWGVTLFWRAPPTSTDWLDTASSALRADQLHVLGWRWKNATTLQLSISSLPEVSPQTIVQRVKGRVQYIVREDQPRALRPRYAIRSYGTQQRRAIEDYIAKQTRHHPMATADSQAIFERLSFRDPAVDLSRAARTQHGLYWHNLHIVLINAERYRSVDQASLERTRQVIIGSCQKHAWRLSRLSILADHLHLAVGCALAEVPAEVVCVLMNNIAWVYQMRPVLASSAFVGTFGEYDQRVVGKDEGL